MRAMRRPGPISRGMRMRLDPKGLEAAMLAVQTPMRHVGADVVERAVSAYLSAVPMVRRPVDDEITATTKGEW